MKNTRRGLGKGLGTGYKNLAPMDSHIHSLSAKGISGSVRSHSHNNNFNKYSIKEEWTPLNAKGSKRLNTFLEDFAEFTLKDLNEIEKQVDSQIEDIEEYSIDYLGNRDGWYLIKMKNGNTYVIAPSEEEAEKVATEIVREQLEDEPELFNQEWLIGQIDEEEAEEFFREIYDESNQGYVDDIESESDNEYPNRLRSEMVDRGLITEEEAKDEDFDIEDKKEEFVEKMTDDQIDEGRGGYDYYSFNFGDDEAKKLIIDNNLIDIDEASEDAVSTDGWQHFLSRYDGNSEELDSGKVMWRED